MTLAHLNALAPADAEATLLRCCGSREWAHQMTIARPFATRDDLHAAADRIWWRLGEDPWREAFAAHPRIGSVSRQDHAAPDEWSNREQAGAASASESIRRALAKVNAEYEARFGYIYIVCATGKTGDEMLAIATRRFQNDPATEIRVAAAEQAAITRLRLDKLLTS
jgi:OHCU decarboxylase